MTVVHNDMHAYGCQYWSRDWLVKMFPKWPIFCRAGRTNSISQSINQFFHWS